MNPSFRDWLYAFNEAFDTPQKIQNAYEKSGIKYYEFFVGEHTYRVVLDFIELNGLRGCEITFERLKDGAYQTQTVTNDLSKSEVMAVFSTVLEIGRLNKLNKKFNFIYARTENTKKGRIYFKLFRNMFPGYNVYAEEGPIMSVNAFKEDLPKSKIIEMINKFKYKKK